jgi:hypothetical protein
MTPWDYAGALALRFLYAVRRAAARRDLRRQRRDADRW